MYLLDANVFIEAKNFYYRFETFPTFWEWLDTEQESGNLASIHPIYEELAKGNDELSRWTKARKDSSWFLAVDDEQTQQYFAEFAGWVMAEPFKEAAKEEFLSGGDPWLIAKARTIEATVITHESLFDPKIKKKVKIPNVCEAFSVTYLDTFDLLNKLGAKF